MAYSLRLFLQYISYIFLDIYRNSHRFTGDLSTVTVMWNNVVVGIESEDGTDWTMLTFPSYITIKVAIAAEMLKIGIISPATPAVSFTGR